MVFPDTFIPAAERNNCIHRMTLIMLNSVCRKIKELEDAEYDFDGITINCSTSELADVTFSKEVIMIVEFSGIQPSHLRLEITESISVTNYQNILANMEALKMRHSIDIARK